MEKSDALKIIDTVAKARGWSSTTLDRAYDLVDSASSIIFGLNVDELAESWPADPAAPGWDKLKSVWYSASGSNVAGYSTLENLAQTAQDIFEDSATAATTAREVAGASAAATTAVAETAAENPYLAYIVVGLVAITVLVVLWKLS